MSCRDINFNAGYNGCSDKVAILKDDTVKEDLNYNFEQDTSYLIEALTYNVVDGYQSHVSEGIKWTPEGLSTRNAQAVGWAIGYKKYHKNIRLNDK